MRAIAIVAALGLAGCPKGPAGPEAPAPRGPEVRVLEPLAIAADAKAPDQALILATDASGGSTILPLPAGERAITVGGLRLFTAPNVDGALRVVETGAAGGPAWRAGVWRAAIVASSTLGKDLADLAFTAEAAGPVDDASAALAAGFLVALTGGAIEGDATVAGVLHVDGTIGAGDVGDVHAAYERLTGDKLPRAIPVGVKAMAIEDDVQVAFQARYADWQKLVTAEWERILDLDAAGRLPQALVDLAAIARDEVARAERLRRQGQTATAYRRVVRAWIFAVAATSTEAVLDAVIAGDVAQAKARLGELEQRLGAAPDVLRRIGAIRPDTIGGHLQIVSANERAVRALAWEAQAAGAARAAQAYLDSIAGGTKAALGEYETLEATVAVVAPAALAIARAAADARVADEALVVERAGSLPYEIEPAEVARLAAGLQAAGTASLPHVEALAGVTDDASRVRAAALEPAWATASYAASLPTTGGPPETLRHEWGEVSLAWRLLTLAAAELAYFDASAAIGRWTSIGVDNDPVSGRPRAVAHPRALARLVGAADRKAREHARAAQVATGAIPLQARLLYQDAVVLRDGDVADQVAALEAFWRASAYSQLAVMLARN